jgi:hypothetical protein
MVSAITAAAVERMEACVRMGDVLKCEKRNGLLRVKSYRTASKTSEKEENS